MTSRPRVVISGIGVVSPFGIGRERFWEAVAEGRSGTRRIDEFDPSPFACQVAAPLPPLSIDAALQHQEMGEAADAALRERADARRYSRASLAAVIAAREA